MSSLKLHFVLLKYDGEDNVVTSANLVVSESVTACVINCSSVYAFH